MKRKIFMLITLCVLMLLTVCVKNSDYAVFMPKQNQNTITLSMFMTKKDIVDILGTDYEQITSQGDYYGQYTELKYDGLSLIFIHEDEKLRDNKTIDSAFITSNKYTFSNEFLVGSNALQAIKKCESLYDNAYTHHQEGYLIDIFDYKEKDKQGNLVKTKFSIKFQYKLGSGYNSLSEFPQNETIKSIFIFEVLD